jgi:putative transposase
LRTSDGWLYLAVVIDLDSDRDSQNCSGRYQALFTKYGQVCSTSGKGNCYDNACAESFFPTLRVKTVHGQSLVTREAMRRAVFEYFEIDYNRTRRHSANGYLRPLAFESQQVA